LDKNQDLVLTPNLPNRFLAVVPANFNPAQIEQVFDADGWETGSPPSEWGKVVGACWWWLNQQAELRHGCQQWDFQVRNFWQITWQLWPWQEVMEALDLYKTIPLGWDSTLHRAFDVAWAIPAPQRDDRCYKDGKLDRGWAWNAHYQLLAHRHDARRQTRDFSAWRSGTSGHKDHFSGKEQVIATSEWLTRARSRSPVVAHLFRHEDEFGAMNLIKRVWHKAYLERLSEVHHDLNHLNRVRASFDSVPAIAAGAWRIRLLSFLHSESGRDSSACHILDEFGRKCDKVEDALPIEYRRYDDCGDIAKWLEYNDAGLFATSEWEKWISAEEVADVAAMLREATATLREFLGVPGIGEPPRYYAVLMLDGDEIGKRLSGERGPRVEDVITANAASYFREEINGVNSEQWLNSPRPLSPSYHLQFSEALANFGLYASRRVVEAHYGQLVYSGGDDVLAMVPAEEAIACGMGLRMVFQGSSELWQRGSPYASMFDECPDGFIKLREGERRPSEPSWPVLVPGRYATVSVGIGIGHIKEPLQDMIKEAQAAEKRAKNEYSRNALALTLFKRSGELITWGTSFAALKKSGNPNAEKSAALRLLNFVQAENRYRRKSDDRKYEPPISGKFPYRLIELLAPYQQFERQNGYPDFSRPEPINAELRKIAEQETEWVISQQCENLGPERHEFLTLCKEFLWELEKRQRPLCEFYHLFAIEAFIARQGE
jgi:CRISPR-associated protein Cmr2